MAAKRAAFWRGVARLSAIMVLAAVAGLAALGGLVFAGFGLYLTLAESMPPWQAGAIVAGTALLIALALVLLTALLTARGGARSAQPPPLPQRRPQGESPPPPRDEAQRLGQSVGEAIAKADIRTSDMVLGALVAGILLGASPRLRRRRARHRRGEP